MRDSWIPPSDSCPAAVTTALLEFAVDSQRYALPVGDVVEIVQAVAVTRLPVAPSIIEGIIDFRGRVVPVLDLRARFGLPPRQLDPSEHFIVARAGERVVAVRADEVADVSHVRLENVEPIADSVPHARHVAGVVKTATGVVLISDLTGFLSQAEQEALDSALEQVETAST